jgi:hypothetical protein
MAFYGNFALIRCCRMLASSCKKQLEGKKIYQIIKNLTQDMKIYIGFYVYFVLFAAKWKRERVFM